MTPARPQKRDDAPNEPPLTATTQPAAETGTATGKPNPSSLSRRLSHEAGEAKLRAVHERLTQAIAELTTAENWQLMLRTAAKLPTYSPHNVLLITTQCPHASAVAGFHTWKQLGRSVRKGEKGLVILAPILRRPASAQPSSPASSRLTAARCCSTARRVAVTRPMRRSTRSSRSAFSCPRATTTCALRSTCVASYASRCCREAPAARSAGKRSARRWSSITASTSTRSARSTATP